MIQEYILYGYLGILSIVAVFLFYKLRLAQKEREQLQKTQKLFLQGKRGKDLEQVLLTLAETTRESRKHQKLQDQQITDLGNAFKESLSRTSVVRFNPFDNTGSDQSFVVALLNRKKNGVLITSMYTRNGTSVYAKPINSGTSTYTLTKEEQQALDEATI